MLLWGLPGVFWGVKGSGKPVRRVAGGLAMQACGRAGQQAGPCHACDAVLGPPCSASQLLWRSAPTMQSPASRSRAHGRCRALPPSLLQTNKRMVPYLFVRGDGVILVSPPLRS